MLKYIKTYELFENLDIDLDDYFNFCDTLYSGMILIAENDITFYYREKNGVNSSCCQHSCMRQCENTVSIKKGDNIEILEKQKHPMVKLKINGEIFHLTSLFIYQKLLKK